ncbi:Histone-lysine N-methyltransferase Su(var)3-9 [Thalictrum thalictroides]|uniref:Histone-lysine N-methyltransferase Su(Var)3-9 n=1 Tax=Thalictrum thalictroides TaxID=46969 RepID=A0A7J6VJ16_THATH|nr:Histone-lysine N-methyltransferase Su(var)3-9 [Thalictrum thalictroides]
MGSLFPFQDLNYPPPSFVSPKIEPKIEPFDDQLHLQQPNFSNPSNYIQEQLPVPEINLEEQQVYAEFYRISELFRSAFSKRKHGELEVLHPELSIVPHAQVGNKVSSSTALVKKALKHSSRSGEMVRVTDLGIEDQVYFRDLVRRTRMVYDALRIFLIQEEDNEKGLGFGRRMRADLKAASMMKDRGAWLNRDKRIIGSIPGVYIGDVFFFRMELCVIGLHGQAQAGIDYVPISQSSSGEPVATSIIVSGGYEDDEDAGDVIIYTGHGGQSRNSARQCVHQKLEGGNLALERSKFYDIEVRVIRGIKCDKAPVGKVYVYDGLYKIIDCWFDIGKSGFGVYKYKIVRIANQPEMGSSIFKFAAELRAQPLSLRPFGYLSLDISKGKENFPISLFNDIDSDRDPLLYEYLVNPIYPPFSYPQMNNSRGCDCISSCCGGCFCAQRNGGGFPYDHNGILLRGRPLVFECGTSCRCPPTCRNRVSQSGVKYRLEIFRSRETGWGVRPLDLIPAGSFICEYTGVVLTMQQATIFAMNGDSLVYPSRFPERWMEWGDISQVYPDFKQPTIPQAPSLDFAMDVSRMRNVACYFSHSSTPNVLVQFVMYDHTSTSYPHLMLFAMENIPPLRELSLDYGVGVADEWTEKLAICN